MGKTENNEYSKLIEAWALNEEELKNGKYISKNDEEYNNKKDNESQKKPLDEFNLKGCPHPFWGNITSSKLIVFACNPSYIEGIDNFEAKFLYNDFFEEIKNEETGKYDIKPKKDVNFNWLNKEYYKNESINKENNLVSTTNWWNDVLQYSDNDETNNQIKDNAYNNVGFFNLCGYHKTSDVKIDYELPTVKAVCDYISMLEKDIPIIVLWKYQEWCDAMEKNGHGNFFKNRKVLVVNQINPYNKSIFKTGNRKENICFGRDNCVDIFWNDIYNEIKGLIIGEKNGEEKSNNYIGT